MQCPGQDRRNWTPDDVFELNCGRCGAVVEFFKTDGKRQCPKCGRRITNPRVALGCAQWCAYAKACLGFDPKSLARGPNGTAQEPKEGRTMATRKIVKIDEEKCDGCGLCVPACAEGALKIIDGKARLVSDVYCDGLGACLGECPQDAITIEERDAPAFDEDQAKAHVAGQTAETAAAEQEAPAALPCGCPGTLAQTLRPEAATPAGSGCPGAAARAVHEAGAGTTAPESETTPSELTNWPVQLHLAPASAPYFKDADLLLVADCVPFAYADFHRKMLRDKPVVVGCPKLDDGSAHVAKLAAILREANVKSLTVVHMEVPCCMGLLRIAEAALNSSGVDIPVREVTVSIQGEVIGDVCAAARSSN